jgi:hypothetical protein
MIAERLFLEKDKAQFSETAAVYAGSALQNLGVKKLASIAKQVHEELKKHPHKMIPYSIKELLRSMREGRAACIMGFDGKLLAFAQVWQYEVEKDERYFEGEGLFQGKKVFEVGSWLSFERGGYGKMVLESCVTMWRNQHPDSQIIAVIEKENERAAKIITGIGGRQIGIKLTFRVSDKEGNNAMMKIFDMNLGEEGKV